MELYWREHRGFILTVGGAAFVGILYYWWFVSPQYAEARRLREESVTLRKDLASLKTAGVLREGDLAAAKRDLQAQEDILLRLKDDIRMQLPPAYRLPSSVRNPRVFFQDLFLAERKRLKEMSLKTKQGVKLPGTFGFPENFDEKHTAEYLARLSIAARVASTAIQSGCDVIDSIQAVEDGGVAGVEPPPGRYGTVYHVRAKVSGGAAAVLKTIHALQKKGDPLVLVELQFRKEDPAIDRATAEFTVGGVMAINEIAESAPGEGEQPAPAGGGPSGGDDWIFKK